jgi:hypothetical protein
MIYIGNNEYPIYLGNSEIPAIYCGEELIYPVNLGTLTGITIEDLEWVDDIPSSGGTADYTGCSFKVVAEYDSGKSRTVTSKATITSNSITVQENTGTTRENIGQLTVTATFEGFSTSASVDVYQAPGYEYQYFTFKITSPGKIVWLAWPQATVYKTIQYSLDNGTTWASITAAKNGISYFNVAAGDVVLFKGNNTGYGSTTSYASCGFSGTTASFITEGNTMSLLYGDDFADKKTLPGTYTFRDLFNDVTGFTDASNLILPATACTEQCYRNFFAGTNVINAPKLPALTLAPYCYCNMFINAKQLEVSPDLLAPVLVEGCYTGMLHMQGTMAEADKKLRYCRCLATDISARNCVLNFFNNTNVASNGVFVKAASNNSWTRGSNGIPTDWTIINEEV